MCKAIKKCVVSDVPIVKPFIHVMYYSFEFFLGHKCSMVVAVGVQTSFLPFIKKDRKK